MIGKLTGIILEKQPPEILLDVNGVGYEVFLPMTSFYQLPEINQQVSIYTSLSIREDAHILYGFLQKKEKNLFRELIKTNGVGPKLALAILSAMSIEEFISALNFEELTKLTKIPGVGKKTAERLLVELKNKFKLDQTIQNSTTINNLNLDNNLALNDSKAEAIAALTTLGYKNAEATNMINKIYTSEMSSEDLIKQALKQL